jgi:hypothetical protein
MITISRTVAAIERLAIRTTIDLEIETIYLVDVAITAILKVRAGPL